MSAAPRGPDPDALLLDELFSPRIAEQLRAVGVDCVAVTEDALLSSQDDPVIFDAALAGGSWSRTTSSISSGCGDSDRRWARSGRGLGRRRDLSGGQPRAGTARRG